jgi:hypothetical protein
VTEAKKLLAEGESTAFGTDKVAHGYMPTYEAIVGEIGPAGHVCELGIWRGNSLYMWQQLFPDGLVVGVDCRDFGLAPAGTHSVISDQASKTLPGKLEELSPDGYDLIVDDASHSGTLTMQSWVNLWPLVKPGGWYVIEDWLVAFYPNRFNDASGSMLFTAQAFIHLFAEEDTDEYHVDAITYRRGLIVFRKSLS